jgi:hypothetical protein
MALARNPFRSLPAFVLLAATAAAASTPTGGRFGPWQVVSIASVSGVSGGDAFAVLVQEKSGGELSAEWEQGGPVVVSIDIARCGGRGEDFERGYSIAQAEWLALPDGGAPRLQADFAAWLAEAGRSCRRRVSPFRLHHLATAARDFSARVQALGGG